jgi:hypothetical protein
LQAKVVRLKVVVSARHITVKWLSNLLLLLE